MNNDYGMELSSLPKAENLYTGLRWKRSFQMPDKILMSFKGVLRGTKMNLHHRFVLVANLKDTVNLIIDGNRFVLGKNQGMLVLPHQQHLFVYDSTNVERLVITFEGCEISDMQKLRERVFRLNNRFFNTLKMLVDEYKLQFKDKKSQDGARSSLLLAMLLMDLENCPRKYLSKIRNENNKSINPVVDDINRYIQSNLNTPLDIGRIAETFKYSPSHLRLLYRQSMDVSIGKYIRKTKIHKAIGYLVDSKTKISGIAKLCGYSSIYAFSHAFKKEIGEYPSEYRKKMV